MFSFRTTALGDQPDRALIYGRVGCFCTRNCWDTASGQYMYEIFRTRGNLAALFTPADPELGPGADHIEFSEDALVGLNALVVEIQDSGARYFGYTRDVLRLMSMLDAMDREFSTEEECAVPSLYIVDHPNPAGRIAEGTMPLLDTEPWTAKVAHRHGLTLGELCHVHYGELGARFPLHIISAEASESNRVLMPWVIAPSSEVPGLFSCRLQGGGGLWELTSVCPGTGTARPYEYIGAPFITAGLQDLPQAEGAMLRPCSFTPSYGQYAGRCCFGYQILLTGGEEYPCLLHTLRTMRYMKEHYSQFEFLDGFEARLSDPVIWEFLKGNITFDIVQEHVKGEEQKWIRKAKRYTLYEDAPFRIK